MTVRINKAESFSVFEVDQNGAYKRVLATAIEVCNGKIDLTELLYYGKEIFQETAKKFRNMGIKKFWLNDHSDISKCLEGMENMITQVNEGHEDESGYKCYVYQFI